MSEEGDWLRDQLGRPVEPGELAAYDQDFQQAEETAAKLLAYYSNWCGALDTDTDLAAVLHAQFMATFSAIESDAMFMIIVSFCNTIYLELLARHGSFESLVQAAEAGRLFASSDVEQISLLKRLGDLS